MGKAERTPKVTPRIAGLIDTHCHLDYPPMADDVEAALQRARDVGVDQVMHIGCSVDRLDPAVALANAFEPVFASVGIHPHDARHYDDAVEARLGRLLDEPKVLALGETGLDYHYDRSPREAQRDAFARQLELARARDVPIVLHIRDAHADAWEILDAHPPASSQPGIVHCFTGGPDEARAWIDRGFMLGFSGIVTFRSAPEIQEAARITPVDRLLMETDAPFLAPVPMRGRKNEPSYVPFTCAFVAGLRSMAPEELAARTTQNARALLSMPAPPA